MLINVTNYFLIHVHKGHKRAIHSTTNSQLEQCLKKLFENQKYTTNLVHIKTENSKIGFRNEIFFPDLKIVFEFKDVHHYFTEWSTQPNIEESETVGSINHKGIERFQIPFWWDGSDDSLIATIREARPDLLQQFKINAQPIPMIPPKDVIEKFEQRMSIPGFGELTQATFYKENSPIKNWMLFEKYDGVRGFWNPNERKFYSRYGKELRLPKPIIDSMPSIFLDGELWFGRGTFNESRKISLKSDFRNIDWEKFKYMVFDRPTSKNISYKDRYNLLKEEIPIDHPYITLAPAIVCESNEHLKEYANKIMQDGAEGIILRNPDSIYVHGKSKDFLKFKTFRDNEARILKQEGLNRWSCELPSGQIFQAPADSALVRDRELQPGDIVSFKFTAYSLSSGEPISPLLYKYRTDLTWEDIVTTHSLRKLKKEKRLKTTTEPKKNRLSMGHWTDEENRRKFFDEFASTNGFSPSDGHSWSNVTVNQIHAIPSGPSILHHFNGSLRRALVATYPDVKFPFEISNYREHARRIFNEWAKKLEFDPTNVIRWYLFSANERYCRINGITDLLKYYKGSLSNALMDAYPELPWNKRLLEIKSENKDKFHNTIVFLTLAADRNFNPFEPQNWYFLSNRELSPLKDIHDGRTWIDALIEAFPEVTFDRKQFADLGMWNDNSKRRSFFENFAKEHKFDHTKVENWYKVTEFQICKTRQGESLLRHFNNSIRATLSQTFPEMKFESPKFASNVITQEICRAFFDDYAREKNFDPFNARSWYLNFRVNEIKRRVIGASIFHHYKSLPAALKDAYPEVTFEELRLRRAKVTPESARQFFNELASIMNFDPMEVGNWYNITAVDINSKDRGTNLLKQCGSVYNSLKLAYPELQFDISKFARKRRNYWAKLDTCKQFFDEIASKKGFDPTIRENWVQNVNKMEVRAVKGGTSVLHRFNGSLETALATCYKWADKLKIEQTQ